MSPSRVRSRPATAPSRGWRSCCRICCPGSTRRRSFARAAPCGWGWRGALRAGAALRLVLARALRTLDLPAYASIEDFADALDRFAAPDLRASVCCLVRVWEEKKRTTQPVRTHLTISDVRRARRATGMTLDDVASVAAVPKPVLRELEWGYFRNWPHTDEARDRIVRYARAAGLDEVVVFSIAWPLVEEEAASFEDAAVKIDRLVPV